MLDGAAPDLDAGEPEAPRGPPPPDAASAFFGTIAAGMLDSFCRTLDPAVAPSGTPPGYALSPEERQAFAAALSAVLAEERIVIGPKLTLALVSAGIVVPRLVQRYQVKGPKAQAEQGRAGPAGSPPVNAPPPPPGNGPLAAPPEGYPGVAPARPDSPGAPPSP